MQVQRSQRQNWLVLRRAPLVCGGPAVRSRAVPSLASWGTRLGNCSFLCLLQAVLALSDLLCLKKCPVLSGTFQLPLLGLLPVVCL